MTSLLIPSSFLLLFSSFNLFGIKQSLIVRQSIYVVIGFIVFFIVKKIGLNFIKINSRFFYWVFIFILIITYVIGIEIKGSKRWIDLYFFNFQASEIFKPFFIIFMAKYLSEAEQVSNKLKVFVLSLFYFILPTFIIFKQPDLGNSLTYLFIYLIMIYFSGLPKKYLIYLILFMVLSLPLLWLSLKTYQKDRIYSFLNPQFDQQGNSYNMIQAMIAVGSGKFFGQGLGLGKQSRLFFLPENQTDFAFSSLIEQFGFVGGFICLALYIIMTVIIIIRCFKHFMVRGDNEHFNFYYLLGFLSYFVFQIIINIGMNFGLLPIAGIALPFMSYGGSSIIALMVSMALIP